jgi:hypothetical protein
MRKTRPAALKSLALNNEDFAKFYQQYPRHDAPKDAERAFCQAIVGGATLNEILRGLISYPFEYKDGGRFIALPATWLRRQSWKHEPVVIPMGARTDDSRSAWRDRFDGGVHGFPMMYSGPVIEGAIGDD